jgi:SurA-like N-terminal domain
LFVMKKLTLTALVAVLTACSQTSAQQAKRPAPSDTVATVGGTPITLAEVDDKALEQPVSNFGSAKLSQALYEARRGALDELVAGKLIDEAARAQGIDRAALIEKEITAKVQAVSDADVAAWYQANQGRLQGAPLEQVRQPIRAFLTQERMQGVRAQYIDTLKAKTTVTVMLDPPRQKVAMVSSSPSRGPASAPVEVVEFSDFQ